MNAVRAGVRSIEHGNFLDEESAACMQQAGAYFVPTLTTYFLISAHGAAEKIPQKMIDKINKAKERGLESLSIARAAGLKICSGSDVLSSMQPFKSMELGLKAQVLGNHAAILSATRTNAELFGMADQIGTLEVGKLADVILVDGNPLDDIAVLQDAAKVVYVMRDGQVFKDQLSTGH
jgi:imidazolonepropionase-like amidohydrolase